MSSPARPFFLAAFVLVVASCMRGPDPHVSFAAPADASSLPTLSAPTTTSHFTNISAEGHLKPLLAEARRVFESPRFAKHLASIASVSATVDGETLTGPRLLDALSHATLSIEYRLAGEGSECKTSGGETAHTDPPSTPPTKTCLQSVVLDRADPVHPDAMACAVDTIVHEWMHAVVDAKGMERFTDDGHKGSKVPLVSYTVGAIAQCTDLEESVGELPAEEFVKCVEAVGVRNFRESTCEERWFEEKRWGP